MTEFKERWKNLKPASIWFLASLLISLSLRVTVIFMHPENYNLPLTIIIFLQLQDILYSFFLGFTGIWNENFLQIIGYYIFKIQSVDRVSIVMTSGSFNGQFAVWKEVNSENSHDPEIRYIAGAYVVFFIVQICLFPAVYKAMGWRFYRTIGTDIELKKLYRIYQTLVTALQIDFQQTLRGLIVLYWAVFNMEQFRDFLWCPLVISAFELIWMIAIRKGVISESKPLIIAGILSGAGSLTIWVYFFVVFQITSKSQSSSESENSKRVFQNESGQVVVIAAYILISRIFSIIISLVSLCNFSKGLKERVFPKLTIELFMGGSVLHPYRKSQYEYERTRISIQPTRESERLLLGDEQ